MTEPEKWRDIPGHPGYSISESGRVLSKARKVPSGYYINIPQMRAIPARVLKPDRYGKVNLSGKVVRVDTLRALAWGEEAQCAE